LLPPVCCAAAIVNNRHITERQRKVSDRNLREVPACRFIHASESIKGGKGEDKNLPSERADCVVQDGFRVQFSFFN